MLETIVSVTMMVGIVVLLIIDLTRPYEWATYSRYMNSRIYLILTVLCALIYSAIFYFHIKTISNQRWKRLVMTACLSILVVILSMRFFLKPQRWDFEFRLLLAIDFIAVVVFLLLNFVNDAKSTILVTIFVVIPLVSVYIRHGDRHLQLVNPIVTSVILIGVYFLVFFLYVKHVSNRIWKGVVILVFVSIVVAVILLFHFGTLWGADALLPLLICLDGLSAFILWLWMYIPIVREWWKSYILEQEILQDDQELNIINITELPNWFALDKLNAATGNFQTPIGQGGSGAIFKGVKEDGSTIAVKLIKGERNVERDFITEITTIANLQHVNLVRLLGYCTTPGGNRYLIYPFFENGSLDSWLFVNEEKRSRLTWDLRYKIAVGVAKALKYLHHEHHHQILHRDIKPANILLDGDFSAVLSDFGISKSIGRDESTTIITKAKGTIGYFPPEMLVLNSLSAKCDVYSYGLVLLELVGGRKNFQSAPDEETQHTTNTYFPQIAREKMDEGKLMEVVDQSLIKNQSIREDEVVNLVRVALWCIQQNPELRPTMVKVVDMLEGGTTVEMPPESPMFVVNLLNMESHARPDEENAPVYSINYFSII